MNHVTTRKMIEKNRPSPGGMVVLTQGILFAKGEVLKKFPESEILPELMKQVRRLAEPDD